MFHQLNYKTHVEGTQYYKKKTETMSKNMGMQRVLKSKDLAKKNTSRLGEK